MTNAVSESETKTVETDIPARMDRLPWSKFHWLIVFALGITWILDGLEVTIVGSIGSALESKDTLALSSAAVGAAASVYIAGAVLGSLLFGYLTDRFGRKRLFMITLGVYVISTGLTAFSFNFYSFALFRFLTGMGIGGEYSAINSAIDEMIPARVRGWTDLAINGSYWIGSIVGSLATFVLLNPHLLPESTGWRAAFGVGVVLGLAILFVRRYVPESPRWLMTHGRLDEANRDVSQIEDRVKKDDNSKELPEPRGTITIKERHSIGFGTIVKTMSETYPKRSILGIALMSGQAFLYNAIFFTYALVLSTFYKVPSDAVPIYLIAFALGNFAGPLILGKLFDSVGRRPMITFTYVFSGAILAVTAYLFESGVLNATTQTLAWTIVFFFASAGASSAYLTVSEIFPLEIRAMAIAFFYSVGTALGGLVAPLIYGYLIGTGNPTLLFYGYLAGAILMVMGGLAELLLGVKAERESLEMIAKPLSAV